MGNVPKLFGIAGAGGIPLLGAGKGSNCVGWPEGGKTANSPATANDVINK